MCLPAWLVTTCVVSYKDLCRGQVRLTTSARVRGHLCHQLLALLAFWPCFPAAVIVPTDEEVQFLVTLLTLKSLVTFLAFKSGSKVGTSTWPVTTKAVTTVTFTKQEEIPVTLRCSHFYTAMRLPLCPHDGLCISSGR